MNLEVGKTYKIHHVRKGKFTVKINRTLSEWATGTITDGVAKAISKEIPDLYQGDKVNLKISLIKKAVELPNE